MLQWLTPILEARQENKYYYHDGAPTRAFALLAERRLHVTLLWTYGTKGAIDDLVRQMRGDENLFLRVLESAIENAHLGYDDGWADVELVQLNTLLTEAGSVWKLHFERGRIEGPDGESTYRDIWELRRRVTSEATDALTAMAQTPPDAASHLTAAWNHAYGRSPDPRSAYREAILAVEAAAIPVVALNNAKATLGTVIRELRSTPQKWHVVLARDIELPGGAQMPTIEAVTNMAALLWVNQTDRHAPVEPIQQEQAEMAVHVALTLVHLFTRSVTRAPYLTSSSGT